MQILMNRTQAGPGKTGKQEQEQTSRNHAPTLWPISVYIRRHTSLDSESLQQGLPVLLSRCHSTKFIDPRALSHEVVRLV